MKKIYLVISMLGFYNSFAMEPEKTAQKIKLSDFYDGVTSSVLIESDKQKTLVFLGKIRQETFAGFSMSPADSDEYSHLFRVHSAQDVRTFFENTCKKTDNPNMVELNRIPSQSKEHAELEKTFNAKFNLVTKELDKKYNQKKSLNRG